MSYESGDNRGPDTLTHYKKVCQSDTIKEVKKWVRKKRNGEVDYELLLKAEKETKDRKGIKKWVNAIIEGRISYEYDLLSWYDLVSILKSSLQKYIRRSKVHRAIRTGKRLFLMASRSATRRTKLIICEDVGKATPLIGHIHEDMSLDKYLGVIKRTAETPKGSKANDLKGPFKKLSSLEGREKREKLDEMVNDMAGTNRKIAKVLKAVEIGESEQMAYEIIERNQVTESLIKRALQSTYFYGDKLHLIISAVLFTEDPDQFIDVEEKPLVNPSNYSIMNFRELDWYCLDFHAGSLGRTALSIFLANHDSVDQSEMKSAWFQGESNKHIDPGEDEPKGEHNNFLWNTYKEQIKDLIEFTRKEIYNLSSYDEF